jgi:protein-disulfide isomerase
MSFREFVVAAGLVIFSLSGCVSKDQLKKTMADNPEILAEAIKKNPEAIMEALNQAAQAARSKERENQAKEEEKSLEEEFQSPKVAVIGDDRVIAGNKNAPITIVEYSDFECPFCARGYQVIEEVKKRYGDKVRVVYKHLPLPFHQQAEPAARFYEAIALQGHDKADKFHDMVFQNQERLKNEKDKFLQEAAKKVGADVKKVLGDLKSEKVSAIIAADKAEAEKFGFSGTPGFLVNGVSVRGAYPIEHFVKIIDRHLAGAK